MKPLALRKPHPCVILPLFLLLTLGISFIPAKSSAGGLKMTFQERAQTLKSDEKGAKWDMGGPKEEKSDKVVTVTLWPSVLSVDDGKKNTIYDFSRRKIDILDAAHKTYEEYSLYFEIGYREAEFSNRLFMKDALKAGGQVPPEFQPFQLEILFGLLNRKEKTPGAEAKKTGLDAWDYSAPGGEKVTRCEFGAEKVPDGLMATWAHFLLYGCSLHPSVMALLEKDGRFPKVLWYQNRNLGEVRQAGLTLIKQEQVPDPEDSWRKNFKLQGDSNPELWKLTQKAAAQTPPEIADSQKATQDFVDKAVRQQRFFDAALACLECSLQTGVKMDATLKTLVPRLKDDPNMQAFQVGLNTRIQG